MRRGAHIPQRTCVACRQARPKAELLRIVRSPSGEIAVDPSGKMAGRGAYVCRNERCWAVAVRQKKLARALGAPVSAELMDAIRSSLGGTQLHESI